MAENKPETVWCIAYINKDYIDRIDSELTLSGYAGEVRAFVPTVKILRKQFKKEKYYDTVPLLFNYGFFELPYSKACHEEYLGQLRQDVSAIFGWVKDPTKVLKKKPELTADNKLHSYPKIALATEAEMAEIIKQAQIGSVFMDRHIDSIEPGKHVVLKGYPFDDLPAEVISINRKKKEIKVRLELQSIMREAIVSFDNVFYTVYEGYDPDSMGIESLDELSERNPYMVDKIYVNLQ